MAFEIQPDDFVQMLHDGHGHWLTVSTIGAKESDIILCGSMLRSISTCTKKQIAALLSTQQEKIQVKINKVDVIVELRLPPGIQPTQLYFT